MKRFFSGIFIYIKNLSTFQNIFWGTILFLFLNTIIVYYATELQNAKDKKFQEKKKKYSIDINKEEFQKKLQKNYPMLYKKISSISKKEKLKIKKLIKGEIDNLYKPIYLNIDNFLNYHYSVTGEYTEIYESLKGDIDKFLKDKIFGKDFNIHLQKTLNKINDKVLFIIAKGNVELNHKLKFLNFTKEERAYLLANILQVTYENTKYRFTNLVNNIYKGGIAAGAFVITKAALTKSTIFTAKVLAKKILAKITIKASSKLLAIGLGTGAGAAALGITCGPICAIGGGVVGGVITWLLMDKMIIEGDKFFNQNSFRKEIVFLIDQSKIKLERTLIDAYTKVNKKYQEDNLKYLKNVIEKKKAL